MGMILWPLLKSLFDSMLVLDLLEVATVAHTRLVRLPGSQSFPKEFFMDPWLLPGI